MFRLDMFATGVMGYFVIVAILPTAGACPGGAAQTSMMNTQAKLIAELLARFPGES